MAKIHDWESSTAFDPELSKIEHYSEAHHSELLPFIGSHYRESGILLVGESHFYEYDARNDRDSERKYLDELWYVKPTPKNFSYQGNFNTRAVVHNFLIRRRTKAHSMFRNPAQCVIDAYHLDHVSDSEAFNAFAFMNYFQRPALNAHRSIDNSDEDTQFAFRSFLSVCSAIRPKSVVFLSKKAYQCYIRSGGAAALSIPVDFVYHPTCKYWNEEGGREKLQKLIEQSKRSIDFSKYPLYSKDEIKRAAPEGFTFIEPRQARFVKDKITIRMYENAEGVYEFAAHLATDNATVGVGYQIETQSIWLWNYTAKEYISLQDIKNHTGLSELYTSFCKLIDHL